MTPISPWMMGLFVVLILIIGLSIMIAAIVISKPFARSGLFAIGSAVLVAILFVAYLKLVTPY